MTFPITQDDIEYIFQLCIRSPYIHNNPEYKSKSRGIEIVLDKNSIVNAYAESLGGNLSKITIFNGLCNIIIPLAFALALFKKDEDIDALTYACNIITDIDNSCFNDDEVSSMLVRLGYNIDNNYIFDEAKSFFTGMLLTVIGHELGHICLSHCLGSATIFEIYRNDERSADLFAQSIISSTPFGGYTILSSLFIQILFTWMHKNDDNNISTHPHSRERVINTLNSHEEYLKNMGITVDTIQYFVP